ncbi:MAG: PaaI family thioesterase [Rubricella sp.]
MIRQAETLEELLDQSAREGLTGLEVMQAILAGRIPGAPIARTLNFGLTSVERGVVAFEGAPGFEAMNPNGAVHGGWFGAILDSCMGCAVHTMMPPDTAYTTLEYKINLTRGLMPGGERVRAIGECRHAGRRTAVADGRLIGCETGKLYATGSTTCLVFPRQPA